MVLCYRLASPVVDDDRYPSERIPDPTIDTSFDDRYRVRREEKTSLLVQESSYPEKISFWLI